MKNILIVAVIVISLGYMFTILANKYQTIKNTPISSSKTNHKNNN